VQDRLSAATLVSCLPADLPGLVVTLGADGLVVRARGGDAVSLPAYAVTPISAHGAGDCFVGAVASRLAAGVDLGGACRWANAAAALFVSTCNAEQTRLGPGDVEAFLTRQGACRPVHPAEVR
jgi:sugar/nucleoside kinase (ribokinase family)